MFKSIFTKYFVAVMLIVLISFSVIILMISMIIGEHSKNEKNNIMETAANASVTYLQGQLFGTPSGDLSEMITDQEARVTQMLQVIAFHANDLAIAVTNEDGTILTFVRNEEAVVLNATQLPSSLIAQATENGGGFIPQSIEQQALFEAPQTIYAAPILSEDGAIEGFVLVCASPKIMPELSTMISHAIVNSILWILLAVLIAVYLVTERIISPLRAIGAAARSFAEGNFDVRVPVRGKDEIAELAIAVNNMAESLNNYDTMRNTFMSNVSHDLRTPMTSISGFIDGILDGVIPPDKHQYYLKLVSDEVKRLSRLVASLLDLSRIQAGDRKFVMSSFDICEMGRQIVISFEKKITDKDLRVSFDCDEENLLVIADQDAIHQIFYNLCDNAVKFSAEGGEFRITIKKLKNRKILISVYNEGQGIADADLPYVFERFYKSDKSRGLNKSGVGLGLFIAKTIIDAHHEKIWVESEFEKYCRFNFTLPGE